VIRSAAYDALARRGDKSVLPAIANGLTDQQQQVKYGAAAAVARLPALR
jgi:HEAT repeat protein